MNELYFLLQVGSVVFAACSWQRVVNPYYRAELRILTFIFLCPCIIAVAIQITGLLGILTTIPVSSATLLIGLIGCGVSRFCTLGVVNALSEEQLSDVSSKPTFPVKLVVVTLSSAYIALRLSQPIAYWPDDFSYHAMVPSIWIQSQELILSPSNYHAYFPYSPHTFVCWLMLPFQHDGLVFMSGVFWLLSGGYGTYLVARLLGATADCAALAACLTCLASETVKNSTSFAAVDVATFSCFMAGLGMLITTARFGVDNGAWRSFIFSGAIFGYSVGSKISVIPPLIVLLMASCFLLRSTSVRSNLVYSLCCFLLAATLTGGYWYIRNMVLSGNPIYPFPLLGLPHIFASEYVERTKLITWVISPPDKSQHLYYLMSEHLNWPYSIGVIFLIAVASTPILISRLIKSHKTVACYLSVLFITLLVALIIYPFMPYSGTNHGSALPLRVSLRFLQVALALSLLLFACWSIPSRRADFLLSIVLAIAIMFAVPSSFTVAIGNQELALWSIIFSFILCAAIFMLLTFKHQFKHFIPTASLLGALTLTFIADSKAEANDNYIENFRLAGRLIGPAWAEVDRMPPGRRIAALGTGSYIASPLLGRRLQHEYIHVESDGAPFRQMHEPLSNKEQYAKLDLVSKLKLSGVDTIFICKAKKKDWPRQYEEILLDSRAKKIYQDEKSAIFNLMNE